MGGGCRGGYVDNAFFVPTSRRENLVSMLGFMMAGCLLHSPPLFGFK